MFGLDQLLKVLDPDPVLVQQGGCLRARHARSGCRACQTACPEQAMQIRGRQVELESSRCTRCGLCAAACPTGAVTVRGIDEAAVLVGARVRCSKAGGEGAGLPCLGWLTADHLVAMNLRHGAVTLVCDDCEACALGTGGRAAAAAVEAAIAVLTVLGQEPSIRIEKAQPDAARIVSRRELLSLWRNEGAQVARALVPEPGRVNVNSLASRVPKRREAWIGRVPVDAVPAEAVMPPGPWSARTIAGDACNGCGLCALFCPTGALTQERGATGWNLTHQPAACVACNTCVELCPTDAITAEPPTARAMCTGETRLVAKKANGQA